MQFNFEINAYNDYFSELSDAWRNDVYVRQTYHLTSLKALPRRLSSAIPWCNPKFSYNGMEALLLS